MWHIPNEDQYWEDVRERLENPPRHPWDDPPEPERDMLSLDDLAEDIEEKYQCDISELYEGDLLDIVADQTGIEPISAKYNERFFCIDYTYQDQEAAGYY
ncbi:MAG: hypothetical protein LIO54_08330 [Oscillospiraceae bacterium]|nr:hypothetical protein [Oscillospiraceae bacterium]